MARRTSEHDRPEGGPEGDRGAFPHAAAEVSNTAGRAAVTLLCDHASNAIPDTLGNLGVPASVLETHIAYDPGAADLTRDIADRLDAPYVLGGYSRLMIDVNRAPGDPDSIVRENDGVRVPGNETLGETDRNARVRAIYEPYHRTVEGLLARRLATQGRQLVVSVHSFTPHLAGHARPWELGLIYNQDRRLARWLAAEMVGQSGDDRITLGLNEPYSPDDRVYHTLERHAERRGLPCLMIELPNDKLTDASPRAVWAARIANALTASLAGLAPAQS